MSGQSSVATCAPYDVSDVLRALLACTCTLHVLGPLRHTCMLKLPLQYL